MQAALDCTDQLSVLEGFERIRAAPAHACLTWPLMRARLLLCTLV